MPPKGRGLRLPGRLAVLAVVVLGLAGAARLAGLRAGSGEPSDAAAASAAETRPRSEAAGQAEPAPGHALAGRWRVDYDDDWFTGSLIYELREGGDGVKGYLVEIIAEGVRLPGGDMLIFELGSWDGTNGEGRYHFEYEGERYEVGCELALESDGRLRIRYSYYGYDGDETWTRVGAAGP